MNFRKILPTGFAVAAGLMVALPAVEAKAFTGSMIEFQDDTKSPTVVLSITQLEHAYELKLSTLKGTGQGDFLGFGFQYTQRAPVLSTDPLTLNPNVLTIGDISYESAYFAPGSDDGGTKLNDVDPDPLSPTDPPNQLQDLYDKSELCADLTGGKIDRCGGGNNFGGEVRDANGDKVRFDYVLNIGDQGSSDGLIDEITFRIAALEGTTNLKTLNPFSNLVAARLQTTSGGTATSLKSTLLCTDCTKLENPPRPVPEIDGPVLIQVGFALGGLYLMLLGRRRHEDELPQAA